MVESVLNQRFSPKTHVVDASSVDHRRTEGRRLVPGRSGEIVGSRRVLRSLELRKRMNLFTQAIISGLMAGALYALLGIGLVLMYRTSRILNLYRWRVFCHYGCRRGCAHGERGCFAARPRHRVCAAPGLLDELASLCPASSQRVAPGSADSDHTRRSFCCAGVMILLIGTDPVSFPQILPSTPIRFAGGAVPLQGIALVVLGFGLAATVGLFLNSTQVGKQLLATSENPFAAELLGVDIERARLMAYGIAGLLAELPVFC